MVPTEGQGFQPTTSLTWVLSLTTRPAFSTWGTGTPGGTHAGLKGYAGSSKSEHKIKNTKNKIVYLGVRKRNKVMIRGYAEQEHFDLGVHKH